MADTLEYLLKLSDQFSGPLHRSRAALGGFQGGLAGTRGALSGLSGGLTGLASKVAAAVTALTGAITVAAGLKKAIGSAADFESMEVAFESLIGDAALAKQTLADLTSFAANTPFELPEVTRSAQKLLGAGVAAGQLQASLNSLGNITAAFQGDLSTVATIFGQVVNKGKLYAEEIQQFGENGVPALQLLSESMGKSKADIIAMATAGELSAAELAAAFDKAGGAGGKFANAMARQAQTTKGLWSTVKDTLDQVARAVGNPINEHLLKPLMRDAIAVAPRVAAGVEAAVELARAAIAQGKLGEILEMSLTIGMAKFAMFAGTVVGQIAGTLGRVFSGTFGSGEGLVNFFSGLGDIIRAELGSAFNHVVTAFQAGLAWGIQVIMENLGDIPGIGKMLGLEDFKAESLEETRSKLDGQDSADALRKSGKEKLGKAFGVDALKQQIEQILADVNPEAYDKLIDALEGKIKAALPKAVEGGLADAIPAADAAGDAEKKSKKGAKGFNEHFGKYGRTALDGVRQKIKGFSRKAAGLPAFGGLDEFYKLQEIQLTGPGEGKRKFGAFNRGKGDSAIEALGKVAPKGIEPPGKITRRERQKEAAAQAAKQEKPRWDVVQNIERILDNLTVA